MVRLLVSAGFEVLEAGSAGEALEILWMHPAAVDLLLSDFKLPDMNGRHLLSEVRRLQPEIRALFVTGDPSYVSSEPCLAKPFLPGELLAAVNETLNTGVRRTAKAAR
jgi:two-component system cell cycle sensor histidine kinase/response regulator CckA